MITVNDFESKQILFVFTSEGDKLSFRNDNVVIKDQDNKIKHQSTCYRLFALFIIGDFSLTSGLIQRSRKFNFTIVLMTRTMRVYETIGNKLDGNYVLRDLQYKHDGVEIAKHLVENKITNQILVLKNQRSTSQVMKDAIQSLDKYKTSIKDHTGETLSLMGIEGSASRIYFNNHFNLFEWSGRKPRIKQDFINSTLDIGYTILFNLVDSMLRLYGFDTYWGVYHKLFYMRKSLVCDLVESFRPLIDWEVRKAINLHQCKQDDFEYINGKYQLKWEMNQNYVSFLVKPILEHKRDFFLYFQNYYRAFMKQKPIAEYPIFLFK